MARKEDEEAVEDVEDDVEVTWHQSLLCFVVDIKMIIKKDETNICIENKIRFKSFLSLYYKCPSDGFLVDMFPNFLLFPRTEYFHKTKSPHCFHNLAQYES